MSDNYNPKHAKRGFRDFLKRHAVEFGAAAGLIVCIGILYLLTQIKIPV